MQATRRIALAAAALMAIAAIPSGAELVRSTPNVSRDWLPSTGSVGAAKRGPGWSRAQVKRMAKKRRNVLRNRRAHRA